MQSDLYQRWLEMLILWCESGQKQYAWAKAKELAEVEMFKALPGDLTKAMTKGVK